MSLHQNTPIVNPQAQAFLDRLHRGGAWVFFWTPEGGINSDKKRSAWIPQDEPFTPPRKWLTEKNLYFGVNPTIVRREDWEASTNNTIAAANCLFAEFDGKDETNPTPEEIEAQYQILRADPSKAKSTDKALRNEALGRAKDAKFATNPAHYIDLARARVMTLQPAPSVIVFSGGGFQCYWTLKETFHIRQDVDDAAAHVQSYIANIQGRWVKFVGGDHGAHDLRRVLRFPGSRNYKKKYSPNYPLVSIVKCDLGLEYDLDQLIALLPPPVVEASKDTKSVGAVGHRPHTPQQSDYDGDSVIDAYNKAIRYTDALTAYGYTHAGGDRWSRPGEPDSKGVIVYDDDNSGLHWSSNDQAFSEHRRRPFDLLCTYDHAGNVGRAVLAAAKLLGMEWPDIDWEAFRLWARTTSFGELWPELKIYKQCWNAWAWVYLKDAIHTKIVDAVIDEMVKYGGRPRVRTSKRRLAALAGCSPNTAVKALTDLHGKIFDVRSSDTGLVITLLRVHMNAFRIAWIDQKEALLQADLTTGQSTRYENEYTPRKADDAFSTHASRAAKEQCKEDAKLSYKPGQMLYKDLLQMMPAGLGETGLRILDALGRNPEMTVKEMASETGKSQGSIWRGCRALEKHGLIVGTREARFGAPKVYELADDVWGKVGALAPTLRTAGKRVEREDRFLKDAQLWAKQEEEKAKAAGDQEEVRKIEKRINWLGNKRMPLLEKMHEARLNAGTMTQRDLAELAFNVRIPITPHPATVAKLERMHETARMDVAEQRRAAQWQLTEEVRRMRQEGLDKRTVARHLEYAGWTANEAWTAVKQVWATYQGVTL